MVTRAVSSADVMKVLVKRCQIPMAGINLKNRYIHNMKKRIMGIIEWVTDWCSFYLHSKLATWDNILKRINRTSSDKAYSFMRKANVKGQITYTMVVPSW